MAGFLAKDPCFQRIVFGDGASEIPGLSSLREPLEVEMAIRYKSSVDRDTLVDKLGVDVIQNILSHSWDHCAPGQCEYEVTAAYRDASKIDVHLSPKHHRSKLNDFLLDRAPAASAKVKNGAKLPVAFYGTVWSAVDFALKSTSDTTRAFYNEMLQPDLRNTFFDMWNADYEMQSNKLFVVPFNDAEATSICNRMHSEHESEDHFGDAFLRSLSRGRGRRIEGGQVPGGHHSELSDDELRE